MLLINPKRKKNRKGFTLIELIVVVAILAILAAIAIPSFVGLQERAQVGVDIAAATSIAGAVNVYNSIHSDALLKTVDSGKLTTAGLWPSFDETTVRGAGTRLSEATKRVKIDQTTGIATVNVSNPYVS
jgi:prepilin-type N-terminal cleavage/methylation domain-containing protein